MCRIFCFLLATILCLTRPSACSKYNITLNDLSNCKEHVINNGDYIYKDFFDITTFQNNLRTGKQQFRLKFILMMGMNAKLLFSANKHPSTSDWIYEFSLGGWGNTASAYRVKLNGSWLWKQPTPNLLGEFDPLPFEVSQDSDGFVSVSVPGAKQLLYYLDKNPVRIQYVAFSAHSSARFARWYYDCKYDDSKMRKIEPVTSETVPDGESVVYPPFVDNDGSSRHNYYVMYHNYYYV